VGVWSGRRSWPSGSPAPAAPGSATGCWTPARTITVFEDKIAALIGVDLSHAEERDLGIVERPQPVRCRYAPVPLRITDGLLETYEWTAVVGFVATRLRLALLGYAGFLQYFDAEFRGADREVLLTPNRSFPGVRT
jgi:hypothetical protein